MGDTKEAILTTALQLFAGNGYEAVSVSEIAGALDWFAADGSHNIVYTSHNEKQNKDVYMVALRDEGELIGYYEKHEYRNAETMKPYDLW